MTKKILKSALVTLAIVGTGAVATNALADAINPLIDPVPSALNTYLLGVGLNTPTSQQTGNALWQGADFGGISTLYELQYFGGQGTFGIYDANNSAMKAYFPITSPVADPNDPEYASFSFVGASNDILKVNGANVSSGWSGTFGVFFDFTNAGGVVYSENTENASTGGLMTFSAETLQGSSGGDDWVLAFDAINGIHGDFDDAIGILRDASPVPEPTTMLLFGTGLIGLAGIARRKSQKK